MKAWAILIVLGALALLPSCGARAERGIVPPLAIYLPYGPTDASFVRLVETARSLGYHLELVDPEYGVFTARARGAVRPGQPPIVFVVQCYADGRATLTMLGGEPRGRPDRVRVPDAIRREAVALAQDLAGGDVR